MVNYGHPDVEKNTSISFGFRNSFVTNNSCSITRIKALKTRPGHMHGVTRVSIVNQQHRSHMVMISRQIYHCENRHAPTRNSANEEAQYERKQMKQIETRERKFRKKKGKFTVIRGSEELVRHRRTENRTKKCTLVGAHLALKILLDKKKRTSECVRCSRAIT